MDTTLSSTAGMHEHCWVQILVQQHKLTANSRFCVIAHEPGLHTYIYTLIKISDGKRSVFHKNKRKLTRCSDVSCWQFFPFASALV